jgi:hypothetical protein
MNAEAPPPDAGCSALDLLVDQTCCTMHHPPAFCQQLAKDTMTHLTCRCSFLAASVYESMLLCDSVMAVDQYPWRQRCAMKVFTVC